MNAERFLDRIAARLGRRRQVSVPARDVVGAPAFHRTAAASPDELIERFTRELEAVNGVVRHVESSAEARAVLRTILDEEARGPLAACAPEAFSGWDLDELWTELRPAVWRGGTAADAAAYRAEVAACDVGVTPAVLGVAATGTLALTASPRTPRCVSLLPRVHVALLRARDLRATLGQAMAALPRDPASMTLFVTGPSRTSDIENDLTIGVHGSAVVIVLLLVERAR